ncbi:MAG TPA: DMT family transporter [Solirubrobacteraceae bacterium]
MTLILGILLAFACALATNIGFIYKHRGACSAPSVDVMRPFRTTRQLYASRWFAVGMLVATVAWIFHVAAMAVAPLSVVQPVLAGGVVLLAVMAEKMLGVRVGTRQWVGLGLTAVGLILLGLTLPATHGAQSRFSLPGMIAFESGLIIFGALLIMGPRIGAPAQHHGFMLGAAAGIMFGVSDVAIKAISGLVGSAGIAGLVSPWSVVTVGASVVAFFASAKGLQDGEPVAVIAITGTAASVAGIVGGIIVFGDPMPGNPVVLIIQCLAFASVVLAAWLMPAPVRVAAPALAAS